MLGARPSQSPVAQGRQAGKPVTVTVRPGLLHRGGATTLEDMLSFRAEATRAHGCQEADVRWLLQLERYSELTQDCGITSDFVTPGCVARSMVAWTASTIERFALLSTHVRLERLRDSFRERQAAGGASDGHPGCSPSHALADLMVGHAADDWSSSDCRNSDWVVQAFCSATASMTAVDLPGGAAGAPVDLTDRPTLGAAMQDPLEQWGGARHAADRDQERVYAHFAHTIRSFVRDDENAAHLPSPAQSASQLAAVARGVLERVLAAHVPRMHPADAILMCKRLQTHFFPRMMAEDDVPTSQSPLATFALVSSVAHNVVQAAALDIRRNPSSPCLPSTLEGVEIAMASIRQALHAVQREFVMLFYFTRLDAARLAYSMTQGLSPIHLGYATFEQLNVKGYAAVKFDRQQKRGLRSAWAAHQAASGILDVAFQSAVDSLLQLPSTLADSSSARAPAATTDAVPTSSSSGRGWTPKALTPSAAGRREPPSSSRCGPAERGCGCAASAAAPPPATNQRAGSGPQCAECGARCQSCGAAADADSQGPACADAWARGVLGASPDATDAAASAVAAMRDVLFRRTRVHVRLLDDVTNLMDELQLATLLTCTKPFVADLGRLAGLACGDIAHERVFGRTAICERAHGAA